MNESCRRKRGICDRWNRKADRVADAVYKRVWEIEMEKGYFIGVSLKTLDETEARQHRSEGKASGS